MSPVEVSRVGVCLPPESCWEYGPGPRNDLTGSPKDSKRSQIVATVKAVAGGKSYFIRYAVMNGTTPGPWTTIPAASVQKAIMISGLTPQTLDGFQVQALGVLGYSDWSTTETIGCV